MRSTALWRAAARERGRARSRHAGLRRARRARRTSRSRSGSARVRRRARAERRGQDHAVPRHSRAGAAAPGRRFACSGSRCGGAIARSATCRRQRSGIGDLRLSGRDFVACTREGHRWGLPQLDAAARREVDRALDLVEAGGLAKRSVGEMSGGERQRLLLAQALLGSPRLLSARRAAA